MKKILIFVLTFMLILGMSTVALATTAIEDIDTAGHLATEGVVDSESINGSGSAAPGETVYYALLNGSGGSDGYITTSDDVKNITIKQTWDEGKDKVESVTLVRKKYDATQTNIYFLAIKLKGSTTTVSYDAIGTVTLKRTSSPVVDADLAVSIAIKYPPAEELEVVKEPHLFFGSDSSATYELTGDNTIKFPGDDNEFTVNLTGQTKLVMSANNDYNSTIAAKYPSADLTFLNTNGISFFRTGEMKISAKDSSFLYLINSGNTLTQIKNAYDSSQGAFVFSTKTIGSYVISDVALSSVSTSSVSSSSYQSSSSTASTSYSSTYGSSTIKVNPSTGAAQ